MLSHRVIDVNTQTLHEGQHELMQILNGDLYPIPRFIPALRVGSANMLAALRISSSAFDSEVSHGIQLGPIFNLQYFTTRSNVASKLEAEDLEEAVVMYVYMHQPPLGRRHQRGVVLQSR